MNNGYGYNNGFNYNNGSFNTGYVEPEVTPKVKKKGGGIKIFIVFIILILLVGVAFTSGVKVGNNYGTTKNFLKLLFSGEINSYKKEILDDNNPKKNEDFTYLEKQSTKITFGSDEKNLNIYYYLDKEKINYLNEEKELYIVRKELFIDNKKIAKSYIAKILNSEDEAKDYVSNSSKNDFDILGSFKDTNEKDTYTVISINYEGIIEDKVEQSDDSSPTELLTITDNTIKKSSYIINKDAKVIAKIDNKIDVEKINGIMVSKDMITDHKHIDNTYSEEMIAANLDAPYLIYTDSYMEFKDGYIFFLKENGNGYSELKGTVTDGKWFALSTINYENSRILIK